MNNNLFKEGKIIANKTANISLLKQDELESNERDRKRTLIIAPTENQKKDIELMLGRKNSATNVLTNKESNKNTHDGICYKKLGKHRTTCQS